MNEEKSESKHINQSQTNNQNNKQNTNTKINEQNTNYINNSHNNTSFSNKVFSICSCSIKISSLRLFIVKLL